MDNSQPQPAPNPAQNWITKIKNLSLKQKILIISLALLLIVSIILLILSQQSGGALSRIFRGETANIDRANRQPTDVIAKVGGKDIYQSYLNLEVKNNPATPTAELEKTLVEKIVDDELHIQYGIENGLIEGEFNQQNPTQEEYLERVKAVTQVKQAIDQQANHIEVKIVSIWFFNNLTPGRVGYDRGKQIALQKITTLYNRVRNNQITMDQAADIIRTDPELANRALDVSYQENALTEISRERGKNLTFWPNFDAELWSLDPGQLTNIFTGTDTDQNGQTIDILYAFGQVVRKTTDSNIESYEDWLKSQRETVQIDYE